MSTTDGSKCCSTVATSDQSAEDAFEAHRTLILAEHANKRLRANPAWQMLRLDAYELFALKFSGPPC